MGLSVTFARAHSGDYSVEANYDTSILESVELDATGSKSIYVDFWYRWDSLETSDEIDLWYWDGLSWNHQHDEIFFKGEGSSGGWIYFSERIDDSRYFINDFKIKFTNSFSHSSDLFKIDDVSIIQN